MKSLIAAVAALHFMPAQRWHASQIINPDGHPRSANSTAKAIEISNSIRKAIGLQLVEMVPGTKAGVGIVTVTSGGLNTYLLDKAGLVTRDQRRSETKKDPSDNEPDLRANYYAVIKGLIDDEFRAARLAAGDNFGAALGEKGELKVWGTFRDDEGKASFSSDVKTQLLHTFVSVLGRTTARPQYDPISSITGGENHLVALTMRSEVYSWGIGGSGQLGLRVLVRHKQDALVPQRVHEAGEVWAWGMNSVGQLGIGERDDGVSQPTRLPVLSPANMGGDRVVQLGIPEEHEGFAGKGTRGAECVAEPVLVPLPAAVEGDPVVRISCGPQYNMAVTKEGVLLSWGVGLQGELGLAGNAESAVTPQVVVRKEGSWAVEQVSYGWQHVIGLFRKREDDES
ncbi:RCC1/BLIP-II [Coprinopsis marcescibilis]|uniref:RCC1/BLIP-II n=1 Tax=Coprinopsis marcescibilis TaxID=230819 RepID=A0A5C3KAP2_COPMA|nr:RCC1/BLIP-II [Coprinopsis marcescibilis]